MIEQGLRISISVIFLGIFCSSRSPPFKTAMSESSSVMSDSATPRTIQSWNSPGQNTGVGSLSLLQGIFITHGLNPGLLHYRRILYQLSHKGSPRIVSLFQRIFLTQGSNQGLLHCRQILYQLSYQGSLRATVLEKNKKGISRWIENTYYI